MEEIRNIMDKYDEKYVSAYLKSVTDLNKYAGQFYRDVAEILDCLTRIKNIERNPSGFSIDDAPVLGLLVRVWKLFKEIIRYYEERNGEFIALFERPLIEAAVMASFLLQGDQQLLLDYRKCSYKDRLRILRDLEAEGFTRDSFEMQKKNRWHIDGKSFYDIFTAVGYQPLYACTYGMMSESIHGSWNDSLDWSLVQERDGTFKTFPFFHEPDIRYISPLLVFCIQPYRLWLKRIDAEDEYVLRALDWSERFNKTLFHRFDELFNG